mmetsp:Transcript_16391/g.52575  ORF Transcript_16391/g.52575 Transcript_16391/m.52575 type:complete len:204 (-) Transcript_16391:14-625(-)
MQQIVPACIMWPAFWTKLVRWRQWTDGLRWQGLLGGRLARRWPRRMAPQLCRRSASSSTSASSRPSFCTRAPHEECASGLAWLRPLMQRHSRSSFACRCLCLRTRKTNRWATSTRSMRSCSSSRQKATRSKSACPMPSGSSAAQSGASTPTLQRRMATSSTPWVCRWSACSTFWRCGFVRARRGRSRPLWDCTSSYSASPCCR